MLPALGPPPEVVPTETPFEERPPDEPIASAIGSLVDRLSGVEAALVDFHRRTAHREAIIDRLHDENQQLRGGVRRELLEPVVTDLVRLYDGLSGQAARLAGDPDQRGVGDLFASFADDVELALDRCGVEVVTAEAGEPFEAGRHAVGAVRECEEPELHNTVAEPLTAGLRDRESGRMRRLVRAGFYRCPPAPEA